MIPKYAFRLILYGTDGRVSQHSHATLPEVAAAVSQLRRGMFTSYEVAVIIEHAVIQQGRRSGYQKTGSGA